MSYTDPCRGDCGANHWPDCSPNCSSRQPMTANEMQISRRAAIKERSRLEEGKKICDAEGKHDFVYTFIVSVCSRCGETTDY